MMLIPGEELYAAERSHWLRRTPTAMHDLRNPIDLPPDVPFIVLANIPHPTSLGDRSVLVACENGVGWIVYYYPHGSDTRFSRLRQGT